MLKGISPLINPELLQILSEMGHGDEIVIGDGNFPARSMGQRCVRCDGHGVPQLLDAILQLFPLDDFVAEPVTLMEVVPGSVPDGEPPIWQTFREIIARHEPTAKIGFCERFAFYERAKKAFVCVASSEIQQYANIILKKGIVK